MLQLTINNSDGYIQLTEQETIELAKTLLNSFDNEIHPSE
jgi:NAD-specific glutamate dehydrogenase